MSNAAVVVIVSVILLVLVVTQLAATGFDPRWRRRGWCVSAFAVVGAVLGGTLAGINKGHHDAALMASMFCAVLGAGSGNIVRILSGPTREHGRNEAPR